MSAQEPENDQSAAILQNENILRRILKNEDYYDPSLKIPITSLAFRPNKKDLKGISVYRRNFIEPKTVADSGTNVKEYCVAQILVSDILSLNMNMSVVPDPLPPPNLPGHSAIPQLNINDYESSQENKIKIKALQLALALLASKAIVYSP